MEDNTKQKEGKGEGRQQILTHKHSSPAAGKISWSGSQRKSGFKVLCSAGYRLSMLIGVLVPFFE